LFQFIVVFSSQYHSECVVEMLETALFTYTNVTVLCDNFQMIMKHLPPLWFGI